MKLHEFSSILKYDLHRYILFSNTENTKYRILRRYLMDGLLNGWTNVHPSNTDYILKNKFDQFQICNGWVNC